MLKWMKALWFDNTGPTAIEYGLIASILGVVFIVARRNDGNLW